MTLSELSSKCAREGLALDIMVNYPDVVFMARMVKE